MNTLSMTFSVAVTLSIGFFIYHSTQEQKPIPGEVVTKQFKGTKRHNTKAILADWTKEPRSRERLPSRAVKRESPVSRVLISTESEALRANNSDPSLKGESPNRPPVLPEVHFRFDRSGLSQEMRTLLDQHLTLLQEPKWTVLVQGHTDQEGTIQQNLRVGLHRAKTVKNYLIDHGVLPEHIQVISLGEFQPTCTDSTPECQHQNRRVSFLLASRDIPKEPVPSITASRQPSSVPVSKDRHTSDGTIEVVAPTPMHDVEPTEMPDTTEREDQAVASLQTLQLEEPDLHPEPKNKPMPIGLIIPEPVHSTSPPTSEPTEQIYK